MNDTIEEWLIVFGLCASVFGISALSIAFFDEAWISPRIAEAGKIYEKDHERWIVVVKELAHSNYKLSQEIENLSQDNIRFKKKVEFYLKDKK